MERPLNLLLVDGNPREADLFRQSLMSIPSLPCRLDWVADAEAGLEAILENRHNVCFVDQVLGPSTGTALIKEALKRGARRPLILNSGREDVTLGAQAIAIGAVDWLVKDEIEPFTLEKTVRSALERDRIRSENARIQSGLYHSQRLESLGLMASGIAHDFNNILSIILASAELGLRQAVPGSEGHGYLSRIRAATERAAELSHHMLTYSGRSGTQPQALDLAGLARETAEFCRAGIPRRVRLNTALPSALPAVHCDPTQIRQVLVNLLNNASDAIEGEGRVDMDGRLASVGEDLDEPADFIPPIVQGWYVVIRVADDGCGMDAGRRERIFDPFFTTKSKGRGLGLASALGIIKSHKGSLRVRSAPGRGSSFEVWLPCSGYKPGVDAARARRYAADPPSGNPASASCPAEPERKIPPADRMAGNEADAPGAGRLVLLVDDEPNILRVLEAALQTRGFRTLTAGDADAALSCIRARNDIALALLDIMLPGRTGMDLYGDLAAIRPGLPVVFISGYNECGKDLLPLVHSGKARYLRKPFALGLLATTVEEALSGNPRPAAMPPA